MDTSRPGLPKPEAVLLRLQLLGRMQAMTLSNESVLPLGRKTRGLLAILAMSGRRPVLRSRLAELLWSRRSEEQARASLRQEIHRLLEALNPVGADIIAVERHTLALKPALTSVDAERILNANGNQAEHLPPIEGVLLEELNGTDPALDIWLQTERNRLREHAIGLFEEMLRRQRDTRGTLVAARQLLLLDGLHERAWRAQIQGQLALGETGLALQSAERCAAAFADRHGAEPGPETRRLLAELRRVAGDEPEQDPGAEPQGTTQAGPAALLPSALGSLADPEPATDPATLLAEVPRTLRRETPHGLPLITVLPPLDLNGGGGDGILTEGLAESLCVGLVGYSQIKLLQGSELRESLAQGRDDAMLRRIFGLDYVLDGTVQRGGGRIRVILRLTDIRQHGLIVWAQRFDAPEDEALALQDTITTQVSARLPWEIMLVESRRLRNRPVNELDPQGLVTRAIAHILTADRGQSDRASLLLDQACAMSDGESLPHLIAALSRLLRRLHRWGDPEQEAALTETAISEALALDPDNHAALALNCLIRSELDDAPEAALELGERALRLNPASAATWAAATFPLLRLGRLEDAAKRFAHYKALFPTHPFEMLLDTPGIMIPLLQGDYEAAAGSGAILSEMRPGFSPSLVPYLAALGHLRRGGEAARMLVRLRAMLPAASPDASVERLVQAAGLRRQEHSDRLAAGLRLAGVPESAADAMAHAPAPTPAGNEEAGPPLGAARMAG